MGSVIGLFFMYGLCLATSAFQITKCRLKPQNGFRRHFQPDSGISCGFSNARADLERFTRPACLGFSRLRSSLPFPSVRSSA
ncbi:hypothetical protein, partial [Neisseria meningitidis]|uniref:hypothetical protein n=1 Tax=Neisseria meningitidis TaxID=487 RepID=UPI001C99CB7D